MADFIARIKPKKSSVAGEVPQASDLHISELAVNTADGKLFVKHTDNTIKEISGGGGLVDGSVRINTPAVTTGTLTPGSSADVTLTSTGRAGQFLKVQSSGPAWVVFYSSKAARTADAARARTDNPAQGDGVLMEVFFDQAETLLISPSVHYFNDDTNQGAEIYAKVVNDDTVDQDIEIVATVVPIEGRALYEAEGSVRTIAPQFATSTLAPDASEDVTLEGVARSGQFVSVETTHAARVIFYSNIQARLNDANRSIGSQATTGTGIIMEIITTGPQTLEMTPAVLYHNTEAGAAGELYCKVTNLEATDAEIGVTVTVVPIEGRGVYLSELHELLDVNTTGVADGQTLVYDAASSEWLPGTPGGAVDSVNGETGVVSLGIQDMDDFALEIDPPVSTTWLGKWYASNTNPNMCQADTYVGRDSDGAIFSRSDIDGNDYESTVTGITAGTTLYFRVNSGTWQQFVLDDAYNTNCFPSSIDSFVVESTVLKSVMDSASEDDLIEISDGTDTATEIELADGDVLLWVAADQKFKPGPSTAATALNGLTDVDAANPTDGQSLAWNSSESKWLKGPETTRWVMQNTEQYAANVSALLNFNGNLDEATGKTVTTTGGLTYSDGLSSTQAVVFDGASTAVLASDTSLDLPGDFTIEAWIRPDAISGFQGIAARRNFGGTDSVGDWVLYINTLGIVEFADLGNNDYKQTSVSVGADVWTHVAVARSGTNVQVFLNGVSKAAFTMSTDFSSTEDLTLGLASTGSHFDGRMEDFRVTKGVARYTSDFTPPAQPLSLGYGPVGTMPLDVLTDVDASSPGDGQVLAYNATTGNWEAVTSGSGGGAAVLDDLNDVEAVAPIDGQMLTYNSTTSKWEPSTFALQNGDPFYLQVDDLIAYDGLTNGDPLPGPNTGNNPGTQSGAGIISTAISKWGTSSLNSSATDVTTTVVTMGTAIGTDDFTLEGWFYYDNANRGAYAKLFAIGSYSDPHEALLLEKDNTSNTSMTLKVTNNSSNQQTATITNKQATNAWQHVALVRRGGDFYAYMDGVKVATLNATNVSLDSLDYLFGTGCEGVSDIRFTRGYARYYEATIELPTEPFSTTQKNYSLRIQDLDDFGLNPDISGVTGYLYDVYIGSSGVGAADGEYASGSSNTTEAWMNIKDADGTDLAPVLAAMPGVGVGADVWVTTDGWQNNRQGTVVAGQTTSAGGTYWQIQVPGIDFSQDNNFEVAFEEPGTTIPLAEGDVLAYNTTSQKFLPTRTLTNVNEQGVGDGRILSYYSGQWQTGPDLVDWSAQGGDPHAASVTFLADFNTTFDVSGVTPTFANTVTRTPGKFGDAATFPGDAYISYGAFSGVDLPGDFTIDMWIKVDNNNRDHGILTKRNQIGAGTGTWGMISGVSGQWTFQDLQNINTFASTNTLTPGQWHYIAVTRQGSTITLWHDGQLDSTHTCTTNLTTGEHLRVGNWDATGTRRFEGQLDDIRITPGVVRYTSNFTVPVSQASTGGGIAVPTVPLSKISDVSTATPNDGDALVYNPTTEEWEPDQVRDANLNPIPQLFGLAAHVSFDASAGGSFDFATDTIASGNVSGITRTATGKFTITFANAFSSNAYTAVCTAGDQDYSGSGASPRCVNVVSRSAGSMDIVVERSDDAVQDDEGYIAVMVIGLLA